jgi:uncharacterized membrane protein
VTTMSRLLFVTSLAAGLVGGVFFAFSSFVMPALARIPAPQGIAAMQSINVQAVKAPFMLPFLGTTAACLVLAVAALLRWRHPGAAWQLAGALLYLGGSLVLTRAYHIPRNDALAALAADSAAAATYWQRYLTEWVRGNHLRAGACIAAAASMLLALLQARGPR